LNDVRSQKDEDYDEPSGMLDLHEESGLKPIQQCGLWEEFLTLTGECSEESKIYDHMITMGVYCSMIAIGRKSHATHSRNSCGSTCRRK